MFSKLIKKISLFSLTSFLVFLFMGVASAKIRIDVDRTYEVTEDLQMKVVEIHKITNNTENMYIPGYETIEFSILGFRIDDPDILNILKEAVQSATIKENGKSLDFEVKYEESTAILSFKYNKDLLSGENRTFTLEYSHPGLVYKNGVLTDVYINAFAKDFPFESQTTSSKYITKLIIPKKILDEINFITPEPTKEEDGGSTVIYSFDQSKLIEEFVWLQIGRHQIYDFKITQTIKPTEDKKTGLQNLYEVILPRNFEGAEIKQTVYVKDLTPEPMEVFTDEEGNVIARYEFYSNTEHEVIISGFSYVEKKMNKDLFSNIGGISNLRKEDVDKYTKPAKYWEVDEEEIKKKAIEINSGETNVFEITENTYKYVVNSIDYSDVKRFGINERQGALKTLKGGAAVCMEYSDLFLTLMRASGVPSRAVFGYGYDPRIESSDQEAHQWVQVFMPGLDLWVDVDVTWGESGDTLIGGDLNHFYTHVAYQNPNEPSMISRYAYGNGGDLEPPIFKIKTVDNIPNKESLLTIQNLLSEYPVKNKSQSSIIINQLIERIKAGFASLGSGIDFNNTSQVMALGVISIAIIIFFTGINSIFKKKSNSMYS